jgi:hypothetical protein
VRGWFWASDWTLMLTFGMTVAVYVRLCNTERGRAVPQGLSGYPATKVVLTPAFGNSDLSRVDLRPERIAPGKRPKVCKTGLRLHRHSCRTVYRVPRALEYVFAGLGRSVSKALRRRTPKYGVSLSAQPCARFSLGSPHGTVRKGSFTT